MKYFIVILTIVISGVYFYPNQSKKVYKTLKTNTTTVFTDNAKKTKRVKKDNPIKKQTKKQKYTKTEIVKAELSEKVE